MEKMRPAAKSNGFWVFVLVLTWAVTAWLLYPMVVLDTADARNSIPFFYRVAAGIFLMIILFGKTLIDLLYPRGGSRGRTTLSVVFLSLYAFALAGGIIFMIIRVILVSLNKDAASLLPK